MNIFGPTYICKYFNRGLNMFIYDKDLWGSLSVEYSDAIIKVQFTSCRDAVNLLQRRTKTDLFLFRIFSFDLSKEI